MFLDELLSANLWFLTLQAATPLLVVAIGVYLPLRAGILNIGSEGVMLLGCFVTVLVAAKTGGNVVAATLAGAFGGALACAAFALLAISLSANFIVVGIGINLVVAGLTATATVALFGTAGTISTPELRALPNWSVPGLEAVPWIGDVISGQTPLTYLSWVIAPFFATWLANTRTGLTVRMTGSRPDITDAMKRPAARTRWFALVVGGAMIGLGSAQLALAAAPQFSPNMTSGRGFIALALALVSGSRPMVLLPLAIVFAAFDILGINLQIVGLATELSSVLPYIIIVLLLLTQPLYKRFRSATEKAEGKQWSCAEQ
ncbi:ABC transporter permease (plasmid) [Rhizobium sullae]|uniref:ABC transporter permease n=1 Tax=Rhizobium sullae TaxID=50338 RepID=A0ABY5XZV0_RHISU|nr:ABC transporter permease [Rhizobium sullae]UWU19482.1 ABC transporter permease [Rhizobium sullae]